MTHPDTQQWKRRATAFAVRSHNHLWGKNNEDPLVFLYHHGLHHEFSRQMYLGWNKFAQERPFDSWGIQRKGKFIIPAGIVFPHIIDKDLKALFIIPMDADKKETSTPIFSFPGNPDQPVVLGDPKNQIKTAENILQGLILFKERPETLCIKIEI